MNFNILKFHAWIRQGSPSDRTGCNYIKLHQTTFKQVTDIYQQLIETRFRKEHNLNIHPERTYPNVTTTDWTWNNVASNDIRTITDRYKLFSVILDQPKQWQLCLNYTNAVFNIHRILAYLPNRRVHFA